MKVRTFLKPIYHLMQIAGFTCATFFPLALPLTAQEILPSPEAIIERARVSRSEMSDVVFELRASVPDMPKEKLGPYLKILDELLIIQVELKFSSLDIDMITDLADKMTVAIEPQLTIAEDPDWLLIEFARWSTDQTRMRFNLNQEKIAARASGIREIYAMFGRMGEVIEALNKPLPLTKVPFPSTDDFSRVQARLHQRLIESYLGELTVADYEKFLSGVHGPMVCQGAFESFNRAVYLQKDQTLLSKMAHMLVLTKLRLDQLPGHVPEEVAMRPGTIVSLIILKLIDTGGSLEVEVGKRAMSILDPIHFDAIGAGFRNLDLGRQRPSQFRFLAEIAGDLAQRYAEFGLPSQQKAMRNIADHFDLGAMVNERDLEGVYEIEIEGRPGVFSVARSDVMGVVVAAGYGHITASMAYSSFDRSTGIIHATSVQEMATPSDSTMGQQDIPVQHAMFRISSGPSGSDDLIVKGILRIGHREQNFSGRRVNSLKNYLIAQNVDPMSFSDFEGSYEGKFLGYDASLKISRNGQSHVASIMISPKVQKHLVTLDLVYLNLETGVIYLTSRQRTVFFQVRGQLERGEIIGQYIVGGRRDPVDVTFVKVSDDSSDN
jgi:hypothetical protein